MEDARILVKQRFERGNDQQIWDLRCLIFKQNRFGDTFYPHFLRWFSPNPTHPNTMSAALAAPKLLRCGQVWPAGIFGNLGKSNPGSPGNGSIPKSRYPVPQVIQGIEV